MEPRTSKLLARGPELCSLLRLGETTASSSHGPQAQQRPSLGLGHTPPVRPESLGDLSPSAVGRPTPGSCEGSGAGTGLPPGIWSAGTILLAKCPC